MRIERADRPPLTVRLYQDREYTFGRGADASYVFTDDAVSRLHGQLRHTDEQWLYRDLGSRNGSFLSRDGAKETDARENARPVGAGGERSVCIGDVLILGHAASRLVFLSDASESSAAAKELSPASRELEQSSRLAATHGLPVFLLGPSGSGKTWLARRIHDLSEPTGDFVVVNCGRLPTDSVALHAELLGHIKGAYTGAELPRVGKFAAAHQGTLFLDEVESLPQVGQDFLLDLLDGSGSFAPLGASSTTRYPRPLFRLVSASKRPLAQSGLRADLQQRLAMGEMLVLPSLEERKDDIQPLVESFLSELNAAQGVRAEFNESAINALEGHRWPGQIRELETLVRVVSLRAHARRQVAGESPRRIVIGEREVREEFERRTAAFGAQPDDSPSPSPAALAPIRRPRHVTQAEAAEVLARNGGVKAHAAKALGMSLNTFKARLAGR
jgi:DNA-binding NtrC family response regulator